MQIVWEVFPVHEFTYFRSTWSFHYRQPRHFQSFRKKVYKNTFKRCSVENLKIRLSKNVHYNHMMEKVEMHPSHSLRGNRPLKWWKFIWIHMWADSDYCDYSEKKIIPFSWWSSQDTFFVSLLPAIWYVCWGCKAKGVKMDEDKQNFYGYDDIVRWDAPKIAIMSYC